MLQFPLQSSDILRFDIQEESFRLILGCCSFLYSLRYPVGGSIFNIHNKYFYPKWCKNFADLEFFGRKAKIPKNFILTEKLSIPYVTQESFLSTNVAKALNILGVDIHVECCGRAASFLLQTEGLLDTCNNIQFKNQSWAPASSFPLTHQRFNDVEAKNSQ